MLTKLLAIGVISLAAIAGKSIHQEQVTILRKKPTSEIAKYDTYLKHHPKECWVEFTDSKGVIQYSTVADSTVLEGKHFPLVGERTDCFGGAFSLATISVRSSDTKKK